MSKLSMPSADRLNEMPLDEMSALERVVALTAAAITSQNGDVYATAGALIIAAQIMAREGCNEAERTALAQALMQAARELDAHVPLSSRLHA